MKSTSLRNLLFRFTFSVLISKQLFKNNPNTCAKSYCICWLIFPSNKYPVSWPFSVQLSFEEFMRITWYTMLMASKFSVKLACECRQGMRSNAFVCAAECFVKWKRECESKNLRSAAPWSLFKTEFAGPHAVLESISGQSLLLFLFLWLWWWLYQGQQMFLMPAIRQNLSGQITCPCPA